jgi:tetratricopeptide (TPR) repeat protein
LVKDNPSDEKNFQRKAPEVDTSTPSVGPPTQDTGDEMSPGQSPSDFAEEIENTEISSEHKLAPIGKVASDLLRRSATKMKAQSAESLAINPSTGLSSSQNSLNARLKPTDTGDLPTVTEEESLAALEEDQHSADALTKIDFTPTSGEESDHAELSTLDIDQDPDHEDGSTRAQTTSLGLALGKLDLSKIVPEANETFYLGQGSDDMPDLLSELEKLALDFLNTETNVYDIQPVPSLLRPKKPGSQTQTLNRIDFVETTKTSEIEKLKSARRGIWRQEWIWVCVAAFSLLIAMLTSFSNKPVATQSHVPNSIRELTRAISKDPGNADFYRARGQLYISIAKPLLAIKDLNEALDLNPEGRNAKTYEDLAKCNEMLGQLDQAAKYLTMAMKASPGDSSKYLLLRASYYMKLKEFKKAGMDYQALLGTRPNDPETNFLVGHSFYLSNEYEKALPYFSAAIAINGNTKYYLERANSYFSLKQFNHALNDFDEVLKVQPQLKEVKEKRAIASIQTKKMMLGGDRAISNISHADIKALAMLIKTDPTKVTQKASEMLDGGNPSQAVDLFALLVKNNPNDPASRHNLAYALISLKDYRAAFAQFEALKKVRDLSSDERLSYAESLAGAQRIDEAISVYRELIQYGNKPLDAQMKVIDLMAITGDKNSAKQECKLAMANIRLRDDWNLFSEKLKSLDQPTVIEKSTGEHAGNNPDGSAGNNPVPAINIAPSITVVTPDRIIAPPPKPVGNNQAINPWQNFKGTQRR